MHNLGGSLAAALEKNPEAQLSIVQIFTLFANSIAVGLVMAAITFIANRAIRLHDAQHHPQANLKPVSPATFILGVSNHLFLCCGMTAAMILVDNNFVRAFAIASTIALIRFRIKLDEKEPNASLLFGFLGGMACGLNEVPLAWIMIGVYAFLNALLVLAVRRTKATAQQTPLGSANPADKKTDSPAA